MGRRAGALIALTILASAAALGAQTAPAAVPDWMKDLLPKTADEKARAAGFDSFGSHVLQLGTHLGITSCGVTSQGSPTRLYSEFLADLACTYDAVVVASPNPVAARLNNHGTFIFTEHIMPVDRWLHPSSKPATSAEVLVAGGTLQVGSQSTSVSVGESFEIGKQYLLFLKRVHGTSAFTLGARPLNDSVSWNYRLPLHPIPDELAKSEIPFDRFIDDLAIAAGNCGKPSPRLPR